MAFIITLIYTNLYLLTIKIIMIMKRFFIFAALLLAHVSNATATHEDPPPVIPSTDRIVLVPQDMFDIDRTVIDSDIVNDAYLTLTGQSDNYIIVINSEKYYGEAVFETR